MTRPVIVKVGGALARVPGALAEACAAVGRASRRGSLVVVPGGGPLADAVRTLDRAIGLSATATHWMAILAMDQYAQAVAALTPTGVVAHDPAEIRAAQDAARVPVLAPYRWLAAADVLPHSWDVTSDSIAAFVAGALDADLLVLLKPVRGPVEALVDEWFGRALPGGLRVEVLGPGEVGRLEDLVAGRVAADR